jgi:cytochrome c1
LSDEEHSGPETGADLEAAAETDKSADESEINESDDAVEEVDDANYERLTGIANTAIAALEETIDPGARPRRRGAGGININYSD